MLSPTVTEYTPNWFGAILAGCLTALGKRGVSCVRGADCQSANQSHNAHRLAQFEIVTVYYRWHPLYGQSLPVRRRQKFSYGEQVFVELESGATCAVPTWMLSATCAAFLLGPPLIATGALRELRDLLSALPSGLECDKALLKLPPKEGRNEVSAEVPTRATEPSPAAPRPARAPGRQGPATDSGSDRTAVERRQRTHRGGRRNP